jgi:hypothetical protein
MKTILFLGIIMILFLGIIICMITCILAQMIKSLCILQYRIGTLVKCQELVQLSLQQSFGNIMCPKGSPKFIPGDDMSRGLHGVEIIPPYTSSTAKLLGSKRSFTRIRTRYSQEGELRFDDMKPGISIQRFFSLTEERGLGTKEVLIASHRRGKVITTSSELLTLLVLLCLY